MAFVYLGTSGYAYPDWHGSFYPTNLKPAGRLLFYASRFSFVEIDYAYYRMPAPKTVQSMIRNVPDSFPFVFKAHRSLTHERADNTAEIELRVTKYVDALVPLRDRPAPTGVLLQFPFSFGYDARNRRYLGNLAEAFRKETARRGIPLRLFIEYRNLRWQRESVREGMLEYGLHPVLVDLPELDGLPEPFCFADAAHAKSLYVRFHGRNTGTWWNGTAVSRYDYNYSEDELRHRAGELLRLIESGNRAQIYVLLVEHLL